MVNGGADFQLDKSDMAVAHDSPGVAGSADAFSMQALDEVSVVSGRYRYFGMMSTTVADPAPTVFSADAYARVRVSGLDSNEYYLVLFTRAAIPPGDGPNDSGTAVFEFSSDSVSATSLTETVDFAGTTALGTMPWIVTDATSMDFSIYLSINDDPYLACDDPGDASAAVSVVEYDSDPITDTASHNDCDVNNDGVTDDEDIDLLSFVLRTNAVDSGSPANVIAIFDVDGDGDVDGSDMDELVTGVNCLNTLYGDLDLDGDVDDTDLGIAFANFTGPVSETGGKGWAQGDVDGDGDVDDTDLGIMFSNYTGPL